MNRNRNENNSHSVTLLDLLFVTFLALKLSGAIDWSWWWVTSPIWIPFVIVILILFIYFLKERRRK